MLKGLQALVLVAAALHCCHLASGFPRFSQLWSNYLTSSRADTNQMIDRAGLGTYLYNVNTCAIRVSYAMIQSGHNINIRSGQCNWSRETSHRVKPKKNYIIRVGTMKCYLERLGYRAVSVTSRWRALGKKGIIVFQGCDFSDATGHVDLFNGLYCRGKCYFGRCNSIKIFRLK